MPTLHWIGKEKVQTHHNDVPYRVLKQQYTYGKCEVAGDAGASPAVVGVDTDSPSSEGGVGEVNNMIIHGDNLEALKALLPEYENRVDCIYIDPPYNTGNEGWVYNDNVNDPHIRKWLGAVVGKEAEDLTRHDKWLCMMYPRLVLLQKLLSPTGAIFISIDDNEQANLKLICDEIFGAGNFVGVWFWYRSATPPNLSYKIKKNLEYILCYEKVKNNSKYRGLRKISKSDDPLTKPQNTFKILSFAPKTITFKRKQGVIETGVYGTEKFPNELLNDLTIENHTNLNTVSFKNRFIWTQSKLEEELLKQTRINCSDSLVLSYKKNEYDPEVPPNLVDDTCGVLTTEESGKELESIFNQKKVFDFPKPHSLIEYLISFLGNPNALILDSFAGSGTTAHAVLNLNKQDGGHRRFILVEMCDYAETITAERVRRVINGYGEGNKTVAGTGGSFAFYELGDTIYNPQTGLLNDHADTEQIRRYIWYSETNTPYHSPKDCTDDGAAGDADALVRGRFGTNRMTMQCCGDDASRVVSTHPYLLGRKDGTNYYFYYKRGEDTVLDRAFLNTFTPADQAEQYIIYADCCRLSRDFMLTHHITFKQIPRDIKKV